MYRFRLTPINAENRRLTYACQKFQDMSNPHVMVKVGSSGGETGTVEIQDLLFTVQGPTAGAVLVEWNINAKTPGAAGMWGKLRAIFETTKLTTGMQTVTSESVAP
jgi:hypothetical protein